MLPWLLSALLQVGPNAGWSRDVGTGVEATAPPAQELLATIGATLDRLDRVIGTLETQSRRLEADAQQAEDADRAQRLEALAWRTRHRLTALRQERQRLSRRLETLAQQVDALSHRSPRSDGTP